MKLSFGVILAGCFIGTALSAAPVDFKDRIPDEANQTKRLSVAAEGDKVVALFEGKAGRATFTILPAPSAPAGETGYEPTIVTGQTTAAQRVLLDALQNNLARGTKALGETYDTSMPRHEPIEIKDDQGASMKFSCASILRQQPGDASDRLQLLDRICTASKGDDVGLLEMTAPFEPKVLDAQNEAQVMFAGELLQRTLADE